MSQGRGRGRRARTEFLLVAAAGGGGSVLPARLPGRDGGRGAGVGRVRVASWPQAKPPPPPSVPVCEPARRRVLRFLLNDDEWRRGHATVLQGLQETFEMPEGCDVHLFDAEGMYESGGLEDHAGTHLGHLTRAVESPRFAECVAFLKIALRASLSQGGHVELFFLDHTGYSQSLAVGMLVMCIVRDAFPHSCRPLRMFQPYTQAPCRGCRACLTHDMEAPSNARQAAFANARRLWLEARA